MTDAPRIELIPQYQHAHAEGSDQHVLVRIHVPAAQANSKRIPLNLALVLDRSGSMGGAKLEYAKAAARFVMERLEPEDRVSVVAFDDRIEVPLRSTPAKGVQINDVLHRITERGSTNLHGGWLEGGTQVAAHLRPGALNRVLLLSDGLANVGETNADRIASDVRGLSSRGVSTSALGIGRDFDEDMMVAIAQAGDGNYHFIEHPNALPQIFATELQGLKNTFARTVSLGLEVAPGVQVLDVLNDAPRNSHGRLMLPNLVHGSTLEVLVKLRLPTATDVLEVLRVRLAYTPSRDAARTVQHERLEQRVVPMTQHRAQRAHPDVLEALALFEAARAKAEMIANLDRGDDEAAGAVIAGQRAALAAAPASARVAQEMANLDLLEADLSQDRAVTRKRASAQRYEKQRGY
jgi:Ca-activated chloride channel family protein